MAKTLSDSDCEQKTTTTTEEKVKEHIIGIEDLPSEMLVEIFLKMGVNSLLRAKCTCKLWYTVISDPNIIEMQFNNAMKHPGYIYDALLPSRDIHDIYFVEGASDYHKSSSTTHNHHRDEARLINFETFVGLDNSGNRTGERTPSKLEYRRNFYFGAHINMSGGLMAYTFGKEENFYICNPIIGEQIKVPPLPCFGENFERDWWGFGYSTRTREYKIIQFWKDKDCRGIAVGVIYTLGSECWRPIRDIPSLPDECHCLLKTPQVECDGTFFWIVRDSRIDYKICSFDIGSEQFRLLWGPPDNFGPRSGYWMKCSKLAKVGDTIACLEWSCDGIMSYYNDGSYYNVWILRDKVDEIWINEFDITATSYGVQMGWMFWLWLNNYWFAYRKRQGGDRGCTNQLEEQVEHITKIKNVTYDAKDETQVRGMWFPYGQHNSGMPFFNVEAIYLHVGCLISPSKVNGRTLKSFSVE